MVFQIEDAILDTRRSDPAIDEHGADTIDIRKLFVNILRIEAYRERFRRVEAAVSFVHTA